MAPIARFRLRDYIQLKLDELRDWSMNALQLIYGPIHDDIACVLQAISRDVDVPMNPNAVAPRLQEIVGHLGAKTNSIVELFALVNQSAERRIRGAAWLLIAAQWTFPRIPDLLSRSLCEYFAARCESMPTPMPRQIAFCWVAAITLVYQALCRDPFNTSQFASVIERLSQPVTSFPDATPVFQQIADAIDISASLQHSDKEVCRGTLLLLAQLPQVAALHTSELQRLQATSKQGEIKKLATLALEVANGAHI